MEHIPKRYAHDGDNLSPQLKWSNAPADTKEFALICFDPDTPLPYGFAHWFTYSIPADVNSIGKDEGRKTFTESATSDGEQGMEVRLYFRKWPTSLLLLAVSLDTAINLKPELTREQLLDVIADHIIVQARLVGIYEL